MRSREEFPASFSRRGPPNDMTISSLWICCFFVGHYFWFVGIVIVVIIVVIDIVVVCWFVSRFNHQWVIIVDCCAEATL